MAVRRRGAVHGAQEIERLDDRAGAEVEERLHDLGDAVVVGDARAERRDVDAHRTRDADRVGDLDLGALRDAGRDDVLRDVAREVRGAAIDLRRILAAERAAAVAAHAAVGVDDDLAAREARVTVWATDDETTRRVDPELRLLIDQVLRDDRVDDLVEDRFAERLVLHALRVLRRDDDRVDARDLAAFVLTGDLGLAVGAEPVDLALLADVCEAARESMREIDRHRHEVLGLVDREAEHQALIARALLLVHALALGHALGDVGALLLDGGHDGAGVAIEAHVRIGVTDVVHGLADDLRHVDRCGRGDLTGDHHEAGLHHRLAGDACTRVLREDRVEHRVAHDVAHFVGMTLGDRLGREEMTCHDLASSRGALPPRGHGDRQRRATRQRAGA